MVLSILWTPERDLSTSFVTRGPAGSHAPFEDQPEPRRTLAVITAQLSSSLNWSSVAPRPPPPPLFATTVHYNRPPYPAAPASCYRRPRGRPRNRSSWIAFAVNTPRRPISVTARSGNRRRAFYNACQRPPRCPQSISVTKLPRWPLAAGCCQRQLTPPASTVDWHPRPAPSPVRIAGPRAPPCCPPSISFAELPRWPSPAPVHSVGPRGRVSSTAPLADIVRSPPIHGNRRFRATSRPSAS